MVRGTSCSRALQSFTSSVFWKLFMKAVVTLGNKKVYRHKVRWIRWVLNLYHAVMCQRALHFYGRISRSIVLEMTPTVPFCWYYILTLRLFSINHSSTCTWNSLFVVFPSSSDSLWIRFYLSNKIINIIFFLGFYRRNLLSLSGNFVIHSALWHFVSSHTETPKTSVQ